MRPCWIPGMCCAVLHLILGYKGNAEYAEHAEPLIKRDVGPCGRLRQGSCIDNRPGAAMLHSYCQCTAATDWSLLVGVCMMVHKVHVCQGRSTKAARC